MASYDYGLNCFSKLGLKSHGTGICDDTSTIVYRLLERERGNPVRERERVLC